MSLTKRMKRILLLGANGQLGFELHRSLSPLGEIAATTRSGTLPGGAACETADLDRPQDLPALLARIAPDLVVNAAAYTAVDRAEDESAAAFRANAEAVAVLAEACARRNALFVHYSTDYVFDGSSRRPWREDDQTAPLGVYGASKRAGEVAIRSSGCRHLLLRTAWVYAARGQNFLRTMLRLAAERDALRVVVDQSGAPTPARWIAAATALALVKGVPSGSGIWNLVASGETSWHGFSEAIVADAVTAGLLERAPQIVPIATAEFPTKARRPAYSGLDTSKLADDFGLHLPDWREGCRQVIMEIAAVTRR